VHVTFTRPGLDRAAVFWAPPAAVNCGKMKAQAGPLCEAVGLAFQVVDDVLDTMPAPRRSARPRARIQAGQATYVSASASPRAPAREELRGSS